jgi:Transposase and inactivated derivatives
LDQKPEATIREFSALPQGLQELRSWLEEENCRHVAMESTGVYWKPVYNVLEEGKLVILLVNARHIKNVPGRKTDIKDAQWIAQLLRTGLLRGSFIPPKPIRELRELTRYRKSLVEETAAQKNRIEKLLQTNAIKLSSVLSDVFGVSGRTILEHLIAHGQIDPSLLKDYLKGRARKKEEQITEATRGTLSEQQRRLLRMQLKHLEQIEQSIAEVDQEIEKCLRAFQEQIALLDSIPAVDVTAAAAILAEIGPDLACFPSVKHLSSWAGVCPGNNESAGKKTGPHPQRKSSFKAHSLPAGKNYHPDEKNPSVCLVLESKEQKGR